MTAATAAEQPREHRPRSRALRAHQLDPRDNSLNAVRLVLALLVLVAHSYYIAGVGKGPELHGENLGGFAVFGFFTISGYLITGSRFTNGFATYLVHRLARLMPAFWVCLVVVVTFFAPIGFWRAHGTLEGYLTTPRTPLDHLVSNWFLRISFFDVAGTPTGVPYPGAWNGSLWSLYVEFVCYLIIGALGFVAIVRRSALVMGLLFAGSVYAQAHSATLMSYFSGNGDAFFQIKLLPFFLGGALLYMVRDRVPLHWAGAAVAAAVTAVLVVQVEGWGMQAAAPFAVYVILWVASVVPSPRLVQRHDISYGVYIYAFPVQQLLVALDLHTHGFLLYNVLAAVGFPYLGQAMGLDHTSFGLWAGTAVNDTSSVVAASTAFDEQLLAAGIVATGMTAASYAVVVKLTRTLMIVPLAVFQQWSSNRSRPAAERTTTAWYRLVPTFLVLFLVAAGLRSLGVIPDAAGPAIRLLAGFGITVAMTAIGMNSSLSAIRAAGWRPLALGAILWALVAVSSLVLQAVTGQLHTLG